MRASIPHRCRYEEYITPYANTYTSTDATRRPLGDYLYGYLLILLLF